MTFSLSKRAATAWLAAVSLALSAAAQEKAEPAHNHDAAPAVGHKAPAFKAKTIEGKAVAFPGDYKGKVVLIDFWATWCPPCRIEVPHLAEAYEKLHKDGLEMVSISLDESRGISDGNVAAFAKKSKMNWAHVYADVQEIAEKYQIRGIPAAFLVDGDSGKILAMGDDLRGGQLHKTLAAQVARKAKSAKSAGSKTDKHTHDHSSHGKQHKP